MKPNTKASKTIIDELTGVAPAKKAVGWKTSPMYCSLVVFACYLLLRSYLQLKTFRGKN